MIDSMWKYKLVVSIGDPRMDDCHVAEERGYDLLPAARKAAQKSAAQGRYASVYDNETGEVRFECEPS